MLHADIKFESRFFKRGFTVCVYTLYCAVYTILSQISKGLGACKHVQPCHILYVPVPSQKPSCNLVIEVVFFGVFFFIMDQAVGFLVSIVLHNYFYIGVECLLLGLFIFGGRTVTYIDIQINFVTICLHWRQFNFET